MKRILVIKNRAFGDSVIGLGALQYVRDIFPDAHLTYGVPGWVAPLYKNVSTAADDYLSFRLEGLSDWLQMFKATRKFDLIIELQQGGRSGTFFKITAPFKYYYHNHNQKKGTNIIDQGVRKPIIQRDLDGCFSVFNTLRDINEKPLYLNYIPRIQIEASEKRRVILGVVATRSTKMWPLSYFKELVNFLKKDDLEFVIPLSNSVDDQILEKKISALMIDAKIIKKSLADLPQEIAGSLCYIGNDTGLKHLAVALGVKTFTFFGPEEPFEWHPYDLTRHPYYFLENLDCRTREAYYCGLSHCDSMVCMKDLTVKKVALDIENYLN